MSRGRRIDDDKPVFALVNDPCKRTKHSDFFGARAPQVFFEQGATCVIESRASALKNLGRIGTRLDCGINAADANTIDGCTERIRNMCRGICRRKMYFMAAIGELD